MARFTSSFCNSTLKARAWPWAIALTAFKRGDFLIEYSGRRIPTKVADTLDTKYLFEINEDWTIDGSVRSNLARYINHSCSPNCEADIRKGKIQIFATRDIECGEELGIDYGEEYVDEFIKPFGCRCDSCITDACRREARGDTRTLLNATSKLV